ncbi:MAG: spermidine/putrescine ABC transporter substrate-binding protein [Planctomycetaceae bacterium]
MPHPKDMSRRQFLTRVGGAALAIPSLSAILAACSKPGSTASASGSAARPIATPDNPVTLPMHGQPIETSMPVETGATLLMYNWVDYTYKKVIAEFESEYNCSVDYTTFNNMEEGIQKIVSGQVKPDVFFPTTDYLSRLVYEDLLQPLQHDLIPNMEANVWKTFWDPGPYYDRGWRYSVPYTIYTTGVGYRRDDIPDSKAAQEQYNLIWDPAYKGKISYYDSYRDAIGMAILRDGSTDVNTGDQATIDQAKNAILQLVNDLNASLTINGMYAKLPEGQYVVGQSWSGDMVGAQWYLPKGTPSSVLGYWYPEDHKGLIGNDLIAIPSGAKNPVLAHKFINFLLDKKWGFINFSQWNGYQPPFTSIQPDSLISQGVVPATLSAAVVTEDMFTQGYLQTELPPDVDQQWQAAWSEISAGG